MDQAKGNLEPVVLIGQQELAQRISELASEISRDYAASDRLIAVGVLKGSVFFLTDLLKQLAIPVRVDFFQTSSYGASTSPGEVRIVKDIDLPIRGADVLLIEDIVDTGYTLRTILDLLKFRGARSVKLCALLDKACRRVVDVPIDYRGFKIDDHFVVGYGLDYDEHFRNLPYIGIVPAEAVHSH
ncbi:MAG: hypoxanthine phosphoribosyltransferase [Thermoanaerobaculia bacterium]